MADLARSKLKEDILNILKNSDEMLRTFRSQIENKYVIIFVGNTRNGKSTLVNYITEAPLVAFQDGDFFKIERQNGANLGPAIGHGTLSHTTVPTIIEIRGRLDTVIIDAPGFDDNRGAEQEIINALYINQIKYSKGVRFVLVADINNIINDNINYFLSFIETIHTIMPDFLKLKEAVSIIFTKDWKNYDHADVVKLLRTKVLDVEGLRCKKDLIRHFVQREDLIGLFKMPAAAGALTEEINVNVHGAIFKSLPVNLKETDIKFGISTSARIILLETYLEFFDIVVSLGDVFKGFRTSAMEKFCNLSKEKLLPLTNEQLHDGEGSVEKIIEQFCKHIKYGKQQLLSAMQIGDSLQKLYVDDLNRVISSMESIGIQVTRESNPRFNLNAIEEVRKKLEYIACIEKVVEKDNKSKNILACYHENNESFYQQVQALYKNIIIEIETRGALSLQIKSVPNIESRLQEVDEQYLFASSKNELITMRQHLEDYKKSTDTVLEEISQRPDLQRCSMQEIYISSCIHREIGIKIAVIQNHIESRNNEELFQNVCPVPGIVGTLMFYAGITYFGSLSRPTQLKAVAGSFLLFAALSWKSAYMRTMFSRIRRRYQQNRLFSSRTKLDDCWKELVRTERCYGFARH